MNNRIIFFALIIIVGCGSPKTKESAVNLSEAEQIVMRSVDAHGGMDAWNRLEAISYIKTTILFDSSGTQVSKTIRKHDFKLKPEITGTISWLEGEDSIRIFYENGEAIKFVNAVADSGTIQSSKSMVLASLYVLFQPFKLLDVGTQLEFVGKVLLDGTEINQVKPIYKGAKEGDDVWLFCFDSRNDELTSNIVNHHGELSYIKNLSFDSSSALKLHHHRKSYFADEHLSGKWLRAEYYYTDYTLAFD